MAIRSYSLNYEINSVIYDRGKAEELAAQFHRDLEACTEFSLDEYAGRSTCSRFVDSVYRLTSLTL
jgi:phosphatidylserine/phosphatidylglycerophosphate/cardiolipin synthase-like enzyme